MISPGTNFPRRARNDATDLGVVEVGGKIEGLRKKAIAEQNAKGISPARVDRRLRAAPFRFVHDVVVDERRDMDQFHDHGQINMPGGYPAGHAAA